MRVGKRKHVDHAYSLQSSSTWESQSESALDSESPAKMPKNEPSSDTEFLDMNDDCIDSICDLLPLDDLCSMSRTCKRIQSIAGDYFQRHYPNNHVRIQSFRRRSVFYIDPDEKYVDDLKPFIRNVSIQEYKGSACVKYIRSNFGENLREISLHGIHSELNVGHGLEIKNQLKRLESIKFVNCSIGDIYEIFLKHCHQLKHLGIDEPVQYHGRVTWTQYSFPTLQSIAYFDEANTNRADFNEFLVRNPQIKYIACKGITIQCSVFQLAKDLDFLALCFNSEKDFNRNYNPLKTYCDTCHTKRIKLEFKKRLELENFTKIAALKRVHGYRGHLVENLQFPEIISRMEQLSVFQLQSFGNVSQNYVRRLAASLPYLEELHFTAVDTALTFKNLIVPFCQNPKLKTIVIFSKHVMYRCSRTDITEINKVRQPFDSNGKLTIYMEKSVISSMQFRIPEKSKVLLKPLSEFKREAHSFDL